MPGLPALYVLKRINTILRFLRQWYSIVIITSINGTPSDLGLMVRKEMCGLAVTLHGTHKRLPGQVWWLPELYWKKNPKVCNRQSIVRHGTESSIPALWRQHEGVSQQYTLPLWTMTRPMNRSDTPPLESVTMKMLRDVMILAHQEARQMLLSRTLPFSVRGTTILSLGYIVTAWPSYHNPSYIWPVGYRSIRPFISFRDPYQTVTYTSMICDGGPTVGEFHSC